MYIYNHECATSPLVVPYLNMKLRHEQAVSCFWSDQEYIKSPNLNYNLSSLHGLFPIKHNPPPLLLVLRTAESAVINMLQCNGVWPEISLMETK